MRILFITDKFVPERGGSQIIFARAYAHLPEHEVTVLTREWPGDQENDVSYPHRIIRVPYSRLPKLRSPLLWLSLARHARQIVRHDEYDQIHCGQTVETAPAGTLLAARLGLPSVVHTFAEDVTTYLRHPFYAPLMRSALQRADAVTSISQFTVGHLRALGVNQNAISLLYPGLTPSDWSSSQQAAAIRAELGLAGRRVLLTISRLIPRKGQDTVLKALPEILRRVPNAVYVIVGGGPEEGRLRTLAAQLQVEDHVRFVGSIPNSAAVDYYHASDLFVMPNREMPNGDIEGFGLVFLEANACGKPVIGGRSGGAVDAIEDGKSGYLVDPTSPAEVGERVTRLLDDPEHAREMGTYGRLRVERQFTWARTGRALHSVTALAAERAQSSRCQTARVRPRN